MEMVKLIFLLALFVSSVFTQEFDGDNWRSEENKWPNIDVIEDILVRMTRKPGQRQDFCHRGSVKTQPARKRHKFKTFVGLMGKRSSNYEGAP